MKKVVLATGVFDILHPGHIFYLSQAKKLGDKLIVLVTSDRVASQQKRVPGLNQYERKNVVESLEMVDEAIIGSETLDYKKTVDKVKPDIIVLGFDQVIDEKDLRVELGDSFSGQIIRLTKDSRTGKSTTSIIKNIINNFGGKK